MSNDIAYLPTPKHIKAACRQIQYGWRGHKAALRRRGVQAFRLPVVSGIAVSERDSHTACAYVDGVGLLDVSDE